MTRRTALRNLLLLPAGGSENSPVQVDSRIELMTIVQMLSGYEHLSKLDTEYRRSANAHFAPFRSHRTVTLFAQMSRGRFRFDAVPRALLAFTAPPELSPAAEPPPSVLRRAGGSGRLSDFVAALRDFAVQSRFGDFFRSHRGTYERVEASLLQDVRSALDELRNYTALRLDNCTLIPGLLIHNGGFQATVETPQTPPRLFAIIGAFEVRDGLPVFTANRSVSYLVQHEFSHSFINPLVEKHSRELGQFSGLYRRIQTAMKSLSYGDWPAAVHEHIVRAITARIAHLRSHEAGERLLRREEESGFAFVRPLAERLMEYESARARYAAIVDFFPRLIDVFEEISSRR
jgi:hypothetical protein